MKKVLALTLVCAQVACYNTRVVPMSDWQNKNWKPEANQEYVVEQVNPNQVLILNGVTRSGDLIIGKYGYNEVIVPVNTVGTVAERTLSPGKTTGAVVGITVGVLAVIAGIGLAILSSMNWYSE